MVIFISCHEDQNAKKVKKKKKKCLKKLSSQKPLCTMPLRLYGIIHHSRNVKNSYAFSCQLHRPSVWDCRYFVLAYRYKCDSSFELELELRWTLWPQGLLSFYGAWVFQAPCETRKAFVKIHTMCTSRIYTIFRAPIGFWNSCASFHCSMKNRPQMLHFRL